VNELSCVILTDAVLVSSSTRFDLYEDFLILVASIVVRATKSPVDKAISPA
jgi:hypothetical protein